MRFVLLGAFLLYIAGAACPLPVPTTWPCPSLPPPPPATNVRNLRPGNIKAIMAIGDSMSAGFAMIGWPPEDLLEWRDYVWSIGGASSAFTLPNILANYNPNIQGAAQSWTWPMTEGAWLDAGVSHASVQGTPAQATYLVNQLKTTYNQTVDFENDWKLLTFFIGANNLCDACQNNSASQPAYFEDNLRQVLTQIHQTLPRTFVNIMTIFNISGVYYAGQNYTYCELVWRTVKHECYCVESGVKSDLDAMDFRAVEFNEITRKVAAEFEALNDPEFTIVVQPGVEDIRIQDFGESYLSNLDCFHPSLCANQAFANQIWNNMFQPAGKKSKSPDPSTVNIYCPTQNDFIQ